MNVTQRSSKTGKVVALTLAVLMVVLLTACAKEEPTIVGEWTRGNEYKNFYEDGTYVEGKIGTSTTAKGSYRMEGDKLTVMFLGEVFEYTVNFPSAKEMTLSSPQGMYIMADVWKKQ